MTKGTDSSTEGGKRLSLLLASSLANFDLLPDSAQVRLPVVAALHGVAPVTIWRWCKSGLLPAPSKVGGVTSWNVGEIRRAMAARG